MVNSGVRMLGEMQGQCAIGPQQTKVLYIQFLHRAQASGLNGFFTLKILSGEIKVRVLAKTYRVVPQSQ